MILSRVGSVFNISCILGRALRIMETLPDFSLNHESRKGGTIGSI